MTDFNYVGNSRDPAEPNWRFERRRDLAGSVTESWYPSAAFQTRMGRVLSEISRHKLAVGEPALLLVPAGTMPETRGWLFGIKYLEVDFVQQIALVHASEGDQPPCTTFW